LIEFGTEIITVPLDQPRLLKRMKKGEEEDRETRKVCDGKSKRSANRRRRGAEGARSRLEEARSRLEEARRRSRRAEARGGRGSRIFVFVKLLIHPSK